MPSSLSERKKLDADLSDKRGYEVGLYQKSAKISVDPRPNQFFDALSDKLLALNLFFVFLLD